jgi:flagellar biosynthesis component FlhA
MGDVDPHPVPRLVHCGQARRTAVNLDQLEVVGLEWGHQLIALAKALEDDDQHGRAHVLRDMAQRTGVLVAEVHRESQSRTEKARLTVVK